MIKITVTKVINKPIDDVWEIAANKFTEVDQWATGVYSSRAGKPGEDCDRACETSSGNLTEQVLINDKENYTLKYNVKGSPFFVKTLENTWVLKKISDSQTEITFNPRAKTMPVIGTIMEIPMKRNLTKFMNAAADEFVAFVETGEISESKRKELNNRG